MKPKREKQKHNRDVFDEFMSQVLVVPESGINWKVTIDWLCFIDRGSN